MILPAYDGDDVRRSKSGYVLEGFLLRPSNPGAAQKIWQPKRPDENDVQAYATFFYKVFSNGIAELTCEDIEPIDCEVVIPVNMMMTVSADQAIAEMVEQFKKERSGDAEKRSDPSGAI